MGVGEGGGRLGAPLWEGLRERGNLIDRYVLRIKLNRTSKGRSVWWEWDVVGVERPDTHKYSVVVSQFLRLASTAKQYPRS